MSGSNKITVWNMALGHLGIGPVQSDTDSSPKALALARFWDASRRVVLGSAPWAGVVAIESLAILANYTPPAGWTYSYAYPVKALRVWNVQNTAPIQVGATQDGYPVYQQPKRQPYRVIFSPALNKKVVLSKLQSAFCDYTYDIEDTSLFDPSLVYACSLQLASDACVSLTGDDKKVLQLVQLFNNAASEAKRLFYFENTVESQGGQSTVDSRA